jgi:hypothetical protein
MLLDRGRGSAPELRSLITGEDREARITKASREIRDDQIREGAALFGVQLLHRGVCRIETSVAATVHQEVVEEPVVRQDREREAGPNRDRLRLLDEPSPMAFGLGIARCTAEGHETNDTKPSAASMESRMGAILV